MATYLILGANSDIATAFCHQVASQSNHLILTGRNETELNLLSNDIHLKYNIKTYVFTFDAMNEDSLEKVMKQSEEIGYDSILLAYGYLGEQSKGEVDENERNLILLTNFNSVVHLLEMASTYFINKGQGELAVISSVAGDRGRQSNYLYGSAKGALSVYLQGLRNRLFTKNIHVLTVKPGFVMTKMTRNIIKDSLLVAKPEKVANDILKGLRKKKNVVYSLFLWRYIMFIIKFIPEFIFKKLKL